MIRHNIGHPNAGWSNLFGPSYFRSHRNYLILGIVLSAIQIFIGLMEFAMAIAASAYSCRVFCSGNDHVGAVYPRSVHPGVVLSGAVHPGNAYPRKSTTILYLIQILRFLIFFFLLVM